MSQLADIIHTQGVKITQLEADLAAAMKTIASYESQIREHNAAHEAAKALGEGPLAWIVSCPKGHEYDTLLFPNLEDAEIQAEEFNDCLPEGQAEYFAIPLYTRSAPEKARGK